MQRFHQLLFLLTLSSGLNAQYAPRLNFGAKFEVADKVIHGVGQSDEFSLAGYAAALPAEVFPNIYMAYIPAKSDSARRERTMRTVRDIARYYPPGMGFQIGISMTTGSAATGNVGYTEDIVSGLYDDNIDAIGRSLDSLERRIFVRIGYEANGFWNGYDAESYRPAFRRVADRLRAISDRIAIVWCVHPIDPLEEMLTYYPGDEYVDWWSIDWFQPSFLTNQASRDFLAEAIRREKPVMIGESTPTMVGVGSGQQSWDDWYGPYFKLLRDNPGIKAFCYINRDWRYISSLNDWGNGLIQIDSVVLRRYREELSSELYLHLPSSSDYLTDIRFASDNAAVSSQSPNSLSSATPTLTTQVTEQGDTTLLYFRFDLTGLNIDTLRAAKLWLLGNNESPEDLFLDVLPVAADWLQSDLTYADRPPAGSPVGKMKVRDNRRTSINSTDVTESVRAALVEGRSAVAFTLSVPTQTGNGFTFHSSDREDGYPPALQLVYAGKSTTTANRYDPAFSLEIRVYPNPTADWVHIDCSGPDYKARILDLGGRVLIERAHLGSDAILSLRALPAGTYLLEITTRDGRARRLPIIRN